MSVSISNNNDIWISKVDGNDEEPVAVSANWEALVFIPTTASPTLSGVSSSDENSEVVVTITNYDENANYSITVDNGTILNNSDGTLTVTLPDYSTSTVSNVSVSANKSGENPSTATIHSITIVEVVVDTPVVSGATEADENTDTVITITNYDNTVTYFPEVTSGSVVDNNDGTFTVSLADYDDATSNTFSIYATKETQTDSAIAEHTITVDEVTTPTLDDPIISGDNSGVENAVLTLTITNYDDLNTYITTLSFGTMVDNSDGTFDITLPDYADSTVTAFTIKATRDDYLDSEEITQDISVTNTILATPTFTGVDSANEESVVTITISNYDATQTYFPSVDFGSITDNGDGTLDITLPEYDVSTLVTLSVYVTKSNDVDSETGTKEIIVIEVSVEADDAYVDNLSEDDSELNDGFEVI